MNLDSPSRKPTENKSIQRSWTALLLSEQTLFRKHLFNVLNVPKRRPLQRFQNLTCDVSNGQSKHFR